MRFLVAGRPSSKGRKALNPVLLSGKKHNRDRLDVLLCQLWKAGPSKPKWVREEFMKFRDAWWYSGVNGETIVEMLDELAVVQRALDTNHPEGKSQ